MIHFQLMVAFILSLFGLHMQLDSVNADDYLDPQNNLQIDHQDLRS